MTIQDEVYEFVAEHRGVRREKLKASDRLQVDLGMDGDDATEFFEKFEENFGVEITYLKEHWDEYFASEGVHGRGVTLFSIVTIIPAFILGVVFHLPTWMVIMLGLFTMIMVMAAIGAINNRRERENPTMKQISISDLIASVEQKSFLHD